MARITGTKNITPQIPGTDFTVSAPGGNINLVTTSTGKIIFQGIDGNGSLVLNVVRQVDVTSNANVNNPIGYVYDPNDIYGSPAQRQAGSAYFAGGVGIEKDLNVGGYIYGRVAEANTSTQLKILSTNSDATFYPTFTDNLGGIGTFLYGDNNSNTVGGLTYNPFKGIFTTDKLVLSSLDESDNVPEDNALYNKGGTQLDKNVYVGKDPANPADINITGNIIPRQDQTWALGSDVSSWQESWLENIYSRTMLTIAPNDRMTEVQGDIRVLGVNPIGTAPMVTNTLYVTVDGNDTNDGRAQDASRACRTIGGALNSPYYQPGTQILVSAGHYLEDNPLRLKPYTSIRGSDIRTTFIEPINKTQDLFHLDSGCYLNYMTFINGRSGLLEGQYAPGFNRGAYATAFPPLEGDERIDLYHSPYVQNCTNQSGPWLKDGTMFVPNQTVQVPTAIGTGTWVKGVNTITVYSSAGTIERGMRINAGQQNPGFFNARTLLLANKPFLQEQVVAYINDQINSNNSNPSSPWYNFTYNQQKCFRDVGILVENIAYDAAFGGNQKAVESGLAYYDGVVSRIAGQEYQTTAAINTLSFWANQIIVNSTCSNTFTGVYPQVINTVMTGGEISTSSIVTLFDTVTTIINDGPEAAPDVYTSTGPDAAFVSAEILMQANRTFIQENVLNKINNDLCIPPKVLKYNKIKCKRDTGLIVDSVALDMLYPTSGHSQSTFAGIQYFTQGGYVGDIPNEITTTTDAVSYLKELAIKIVQNITPADDLVNRYSGATQYTGSEPASEEEVYTIGQNFDIVLSILKGNKSGWTDKIVSNGAPKDLLGIRNAVALLKANKENDYFATEIIAYIAAKHPLFAGMYDQNKCRRDVGYIIDSVMFDLLHGGNRQSVQAGLSYYGFNSSRVIRETEKAATTSSFKFVSDLARDIIRNVPVVPYQTKVSQRFSSTTGTLTEANLIDIAASTVTNIIWNGTATVTWGLTPISTATVSAGPALYSFNLLLDNKEFIKEEVVARLDSLYNANSFQYNEEKCYRDVGLIIDAVSQDILLGGNQKSIEAGLSYWSAGYNYVAGQITTTTQAIQYASTITLQVIANSTVTAQSGTVSTQIINPFFKYGGDYMPQEAVKRNFKIITDILENGPNAAPPPYAGGGLFALTGLNGADVKLSPIVTSVTTVTTGTYLVGLNTSTIGFGNNATLYFGEVGSIPLLDSKVESLSLQYTGSTSTWDQRKIDPLGSMGGSLVDGAVISDRSPIQSFVYDAFTQVNQGGKGIKITNNGYAQLVSVFTIFCSTGVEVDNGGIASITNSNCNFGDLSLVAKGYGKRNFSGTVFNPTFRSYPFSPTGVPGSDELDQYYPNGFWPNRGLVEIFTPDLDDRPHIGLVMEVVPPDGHLNEQSFPGFLNSQPSTSTLTTSTIVLKNIDTTDIAIGNEVFIRDQFGKQFDSNGNWYAATGTVVVDVGYNSIVLNQALTSGGGDPTNPNYFTLYFCGNSYYTVLSSTVANSPYEPGKNILKRQTNPLYQGPRLGDQITEHYLSLVHLNELVKDVISNTVITPSAGNTTTSQTILPLVTGGAQAETFINQRFDIITGILTATNITAAESVVPPRAVTKTGTVVPGAGSAVTLIKANLDFLAEEVSQYVQTDPVVSLVLLGQTPEVINYILTKCKRDTKIILQRIIYDLQSGGTYNSVMTGLSYWSRPGSHHIVELGEAATRTDLFPDGSVVNFYQRSYISASGYLFEYVGAGTNYGVLPQVGRADPVQSKEVVQLDSGKVFFTSTDQNGDFRIGKGLVISQATGVLSGRTFVQSLYANMTPFILAIT